MDPKQFENFQNDMQDLAKMFEKSLPKPIAPPDMPAGYYADGGQHYSERARKLQAWNLAYMPTFKFTWRHWAFLWSIIASVVETLMIIHGGPR